MAWPSYHSSSTTPPRNLAGTLITTPPRNLAGTLNCHACVASTMHVRDAVEDDATALATRTELPADAVCQLIHDRTVCVAELDDEREDATVIDDPSTDGPTTESADDGAADGPTDVEQPTGAAAEDREICGFLAFDADEGAVHVTQVAGDREAVAMLLAEPIRFAENEGMPVEVFVPDAETPVVEAVEDAGFQVVDRGPWFGGEPTRRYRLETRAE